MKKILPLIAVLLAMSACSGGGDAPLASQDGYTIVCPPGSEWLCEVETLDSGFQYINISSLDYSATINVNEIFGDSLEQAFTDEVKNVPKVNDLATFKQEGQESGVPYAIFDLNSEYLGTKGKLMMRGYDLGGKYFNCELEVEEANYDQYKIDYLEACDSLK